MSTCSAVSDILIGKVILESCGGTGVVFSVQSADVGDYFYSRPDEIITS